jgi:hypothetical protein
MLELRIKIKLVVTVMAMVAVVCTVDTTAAFGHKTLTLVPSSHIGWRVDETTGADVCTEASHDICRRGKLDAVNGDSFYPSSVAVDPNTGDVYVADIENHRVEKFMPTGVFVSMFGWDVNETKVKQAGATRAEKNICAAASKDVCTRGVAGARPGQLSAPVSITVDPVTGDVYVLDATLATDVRVDKYTSDGRFVWRLGKDVNRTTAGNLCAALEVERDGAQCGPGEESSLGSLVRGAFKSIQPGDLIAAGGPQDLLYVGDEHRVQVFDADGEWRREILLASISAQPHSSVAALALDPVGGLYVVYRAGSIGADSPTEHADLVHEFNPAGEHVAEYTIGARHNGSFDSLNAMAVDSFGHLALMGVEFGAGTSVRIGMLYAGNDGHLIAEFAVPGDNDGIALDGHGDLYVATAIGYEVAEYAIREVPWLDELGASMFASGLP